MYEWESKWRKPFLKGEYTEQELVDYYMMMALDPIEERFLSVEVMTILAKYINETSTATTFTSVQDGQKKSGPINKPKTYSAEEIYALMFSSGVDIDFENRNLNRLLIILRIIGSYNEPPKKMTKQEIFKQNSSLNAQRKAQMKSKG